MTGIPDPRPRVRDTDAGPRLDGWRCERCGRASAVDAPCCPSCRGLLRPALFDLNGTVWSATVLRVPLPGRQPPSALAYIDLDDGPRVLGHIHGRHDERLRAGTRVHGTGLTADGDLQFEEKP
jgi:uncharacterized OB-fold protein